MSRLAPAAADAGFERLTDPVAVVHVELFDPPRTAHIRLVAAQVPSDWDRLDSTDRAAEALEAAVGMLRGTPR